MRPVQEILFKTSESAYAVDRDGRIVAWNKAAEISFGYGCKDAVGKNCWELLCGQDSFGNRYCCQGCPVRETAFRQKMVNRFQVKFKTATYGLKDFTVSALLLRGSDGQDIMVHLCRTEVTLDTPAIKFHSNQEPASQDRRGNLTQREHEILSMLSEGNSTVEISSAMRISVFTVRNHIQHILSKLQVNSRLKAISLSRRLGII